jgi:hypothetical protein
MERRRLSVVFIGLPKVISRKLTFSNAEKAAVQLADEVLRLP